MTIFNKPLGWYYHKLMCELWYKLKGTGVMYYKHINIMIAFYSINLYGESHVEHKDVINRFKTKYNRFWKRF